MQNDNEKKKSKCCNAPVGALGMDDGVPCNFWCNKCGSHCDVIRSCQPQNEAKERLIPLKEVRRIIQNEIDNFVYTADDRFNRIALDIMKRILWLFEERNLYHQDVCPGHNCQSCNSTSHDNP